MATRCDGIVKLTVILGYLKAMMSLALQMSAPECQLLKIEWLGNSPIFLRFGACDDV